MYYKIVPDFNVIGNFPQASYTDYFDMTVVKLGESWKCPDFKLLPRAKLTDYVFNIGEGFGSVISKSFYCLLKELRISEHQSFELNLTSRSKIYTNYYYIHYIKNENFFEYIDWGNSKLFKYYNHTEKLELLNFTSYERLLEYEQNIIDTKYQVGGELAIKNLDLDFINFRFPFFPQGIVCSERCKEALENSKLTGFKFEVLNQFK